MNEDKERKARAYIRSLELEITEDVLFELTDTSKKSLLALKKQGYKIAIDDFGTGFSNFDYLQQIEVDVLKIDKSFVNRIQDTSKSYLVVEAIIKMSHILGVTVVAEGVETKAQLKSLKSMGCDIVQGYYYSKPLSLDDFLELAPDSAW